MLVSKNAGNLRHLMQNTNESQWNIGCVGFQTQNSCVGHVNFMSFGSILFALGSQGKHSFQWKMGLSFNYNSRVMFGYSFERGSVLKTNII